MSKFEFQREHDGSLSLDSAVFQAIGAASACWTNLQGSGVFESERAKEIGEVLLAFINDNLLKPFPYRSNFRGDLEHLINRHSMENGSDTPDHILADFLDACLKAFDQATRDRTNWYVPPEPTDPSMVPWSDPNSEPSALAKKAWAETKANPSHITELGEFE